MRQVVEHTCVNDSGLVWEACAACQVLFERGEHWTQQPGALHMPVFRLSPLEVYKKTYDSTSSNIPNRETAAHENAVGQVFAMGVDFARERRDILLRELMDAFEECRWEDGQAAIKNALAEPKARQ